MKQGPLIFGLSAVLLIVIAASGAVLFYLPEDEPAVVEDAPLLTDTSSGSGGGVFDTAVLNRSGYTELNTGLVQSGRLPVKPPAAVGKVNPFL